MSFEIKKKIYRKEKFMKIIRKIIACVMACIGVFSSTITLNFDIVGFPMGWDVDCGTYSGSATATGHA